MSFYDATGDARIAMIKGLHELADFLNDNPGVPAPQRMELQLSTFGPTMADRMSSVDQFARAVDTKPEWWDDAQTHYMATRKFGPVRFFCVAIDRGKDEGVGS